MKPPPPAHISPGRMVWLFVSSLLLLLLGLYSEFGTSPAPVVPIGQVTGFAILCVAAGCAIGVIDRYQPKIGSWLYLLPAAWIFVQQGLQHTSALPILLYASIFQVLRAVLRISMPTE